MNRCSACGDENSEKARFCQACGTPLESPSGTRQERRVVSVLFVDLVGFTSKSEQLDPEDVRSFLTVYYERARAEIERFGGRVEKFIGDAVMAVFGAPVAYGDDPERAVRAAMAVRDSIADMDQADPLLVLQVRAAVNTGEAIVELSARPDAGVAMVAGDVVNTASRLQSNALVNVFGPAGIGKSRLAHELAHRATDAGGLAIRGRSAGYGDAGPYSAFAQQVSQIVGIDGDDPASAVEKLRSKAAALAVADDP